MDIEEIPQTTINYDKAMWREKKRTEKYENEIYVEQF